MKNKLPWILLALSLVVNVAFLGGAFFLHNKAERWQGMPQAERMERMADRLDLDAGQRQKFMAIAEARDSRRASSWRDVREQISDLLLREDATRDDFRAILNADREARTDDFIDRLMATHAFLMSLPEDKRRDIHEMMGDRDSPIRRALRN
jgi:hypothetical protein